MKRLLSSLAILASVLLLAPKGFAADNQQSWEKRVGDSMIYYSVFNSQFISPKVAKEYGITRGHNRALVNISTTDILEQGESLGKPAKVSGYGQTLIGQRIPLEFRAVSYPTTVYYIAEFRYSTREIINFYIDITPQRTGKTTSLEFSKKLYHEDK